jgi:hypothetical protein
VTPAKRTGPALLLAPLLFLFVAAGGGEPDGAITLRGEVTVRGSEPHTMVVIASAERGDVELTGPLAAELRARHQLRWVEVRCRITAEAAGPGFPARAEVLKIVRVR